jgi:hypothetical protein
MIVENADEADILFKQAAKPMTSPKQRSCDEPLSTFSPQKSNGSILGTSRNFLAAFRLVGGQQNIIDGEQMDERDAMALLSSKVTVDPSNEQDATPLLQSLGHIPLEIIQAAADVNFTAPRMTIAKCLGRFPEDEANRARFLDADMGDLRRNPSVPNAVFKTCQISFAQIREASPSAADLFSLMCVLDH